LQQEEHRWRRLMAVTKSAEMYMSPVMLKDTTSQSSDVEGHDLDSCISAIQKYQSKIPEQKFDLHTKQDHAPERGNTLGGALHGGAPSLAEEWNGREPALIAVLPITLETPFPTFADLTLKHSIANP